MGPLNARLALRISIAASDPEQDLHEADLLQGGIDLLRPALLAREVCTVGIQIGQEHVAPGAAEAELDASLAQPADRTCGLLQALDGGIILAQRAGQSIQPAQKLGADRAVHLFLDKLRRGDTHLLEQHAILRAVDPVGIESLDVGGKVDQTAHHVRRQGCLLPAQPCRRAPHRGHAVVDQPVGADLALTARKTKLGRTEQSENEVARRASAPGAAPAAMPSSRRPPCAPRR